MKDMLRRPAVAGSWYPAAASALTSAVDGYLATAEASQRLTSLVALIAPHAGLMYSGPVAAFAYQQLRDRPVELIVLVGPSHFVAFDGVSIHPSGGFETPLGTALVDDVCARELKAATTIVREVPEAHRREHSLEMQLPFLRRVAPSARIVPLVMGAQTSDTSEELAIALTKVLRLRRARGERIVLVASTDLSHYHDAATAAALDGIVIDHVARFDEEGLQKALDRRPEHACGGGPAVAVMRAARQLGARDGVVLKYADSGDVSGDKSQVVGYLAAAFGTV
jgi:AmmeMemoRadiSam system protein B